MPPFIGRDVVAERLRLIFPDGTPNRTYCVRELAASTVFAALYIGAVEGADRFLGPVHVYRMTGEQSVRASQADRDAYRVGVFSRKFGYPAIAGTPTTPASPFATKRCVTVLSPLAPCSAARICRQHRAFRATR